MSGDLQTLAFLHAHGIATSPRGLEEALRAAVESMASGYFTEPGREGLTEAEVQVARAGGLVPETRDGGVDPLAASVVGHARLIESGLTTHEAAELLKVSEARVRQRIAEKTLLAIRSGRVWRLPPFQFLGTGELPGWAELCRALPSTASPVVIEQWLLLAHPDLVVGDGEEPMSPRRWLAEGRPAAAVAELVQELR